MTKVLYELGHLRLVGEGDRLSVRACITQTERRGVAKRSQPLNRLRPTATSWRCRRRSTCSRNYPPACQRRSASARGDQCPLMALNIEGRHHVY